MHECDARNFRGRRAGWLDAADRVLHCDDGLEDDEPQHEYLGSSAACTPPASRLTTKTHRGEPGRQPVKTQAHRWWRSRISTAGTSALYDPSKGWLRRQPVRRSGANDQPLSFRRRRRHDAYSAPVPNRRGPRGRNTRVAARDAIATTQPILFHPHRGIAGTDDRLGVARRVGQYKANLHAATVAWPRSGTRSYADVPRVGSAKERVLDKTSPTRTHHDQLRDKRSRQRHRAELPQKFREFSPSWRPWAFEAPAAPTRDGSDA